MHRCILSFAKLPNDPLPETENASVSFWANHWTQYQLKLNLKTNCIPAICGFNATATVRSQLISSPNWPKLYPESVRCEWNVENNNERFQIQLFIPSYNIQPLGDFLQVYSSFQAEIWTNCLDKKCHDFFWALKLTQS